MKSGPWRLIFMGTPQFALPSLEAILAAGEEVAAVVTQPDRPRGRGQVVTPSPVKELALAWNLPVLQPQRLKDPELIGRLQALAPEIMIVVAYGRILPHEILALPSVGVLNVHASLLPRYRGAAPINWALIRGEKETGVTIQWLRYEVDSGPIFLQERVPIAAEDNSGTLYDRLAERGAALLVQSLEMLRRGEAVKLPQDVGRGDPGPASLPGDAPSPLGTSGPGSGRLDPGPGPQAGSLSLVAGPGAQVIRRPGEKEARGAWAAPGTVLRLTPQGLEIACGQGSVTVEALQLAGHKRLVAAEFLRGQPLIGQRLE